MSILFIIALYFGITLLFIILGAILQAIPKWIFNAKYQRKLNKITPDLIKFDLKKAQQTYLNRLNEYQLLQPALKTFFKINIGDGRVKTIDEYLKFTGNKKTFKRRKKRRYISACFFIL